MYPCANVAGHKKTQEIYNESSCRNLLEDILHQKQKTKNKTQKTKSKKNPKNKNMIKR